MGRLPVAIIGGGPAGAVCALRLARMGHPVVLFEKRAFPAARPVETCTPRVRQLIEAACGEALPPRLFLPLGEFFSAWGSGEMAARLYTFWHAVPGLALDRAGFDAWLLSLAEAAGVAVHHGRCVVAAERGHRRWRLILRRGEETLPCEAGFVVEATGATTRSPVQAGTGRFFTDRLVCISADLPDAADGVVAAVESCPMGWWYTAPAQGGLRTMSLFVDVETVMGARRYAALFAQALNGTAHLAGIVADLPDDTTVRAICARTSIRSALWNGAWVAVGDAARTIDPLSGGGLGRAVEDALEAAQAVSKALRRSDYSGMRSYALKRAESFRQQIAIQRHHYCSERRWPESEFWKRRHSSR
jgi:flavin-dependent dehydrogenase